MSSAVVVYGFETSNNMKVRVALGYKGIAYEFRSIDPKDREEIRRISGQFLTPVLVHGERVVSDSAAILRYLDAEFSDTPHLFGDSHAQQWEIEDWEFFARVDLARPMMEVVHLKVYGKEVGAELMQRCSTNFAEAVTKLAAKMSGQAWLVGERMSAADITAAAVLTRVQNAELFPLPAAMSELASWQNRVMHFDGEMRA